MFDLLEKNNALNITIAINEVPANFPKGLEVDCDSPEWKQALKKAEQAKNQSYNIIYRDTDQGLKEAWHFLSDLNIAYIRNKYKHEKKDILYFELKTKDYGERLKAISGKRGEDDGKFYAV
jgi:hypothetical protein